MGIFKKLKSKFTFAENKAFKEIGSTGTFITGGLIEEDYSTQFLFDNSVKTYDKMRKGDAQVHASLQAIKMPLQTANWFIDLHEDGDPETQEFIQDALFKKIDWDCTLSEILSYLDFGFYYFEKVFTVDENGWIIWKSFAPRIPTAHLYWKTEKGKGSGAGKNEGITQQLKINQIGDKGEPVDNMNPQIPMNKLLLFTNRKEGTNYEGQSLLRTAYKHWKMKDLAYKVQLISIERHGVGIPIITLPANASDDDHTAAKEILKNLKSNEKNYAILTEGTTLDIKTVGTGKDGQMKDAIEHHNRMITMNILAPFLDLGSGSSGSFALGKTQMDFFLASLQNIGKYVCEVINEAIKELVIVNFGEQEYYPELKVTEIGSIDKEALMNALATGINSGAIIVDERLRDYTRDNLNLPEEDKEEIEEAMVKKEEMAKAIQENKNIDKPKEEKEEEKELEKEKEMSDKTFNKKQWLSIRPLEGNEYSKQLLMKLKDI